MKCDEFFGFYNARAEALCFENITLGTGYADFLPHEVSLKSPLSRRVQLNFPVASAAMDTVTEARLAIALARAGGIGFIHRNLSPEKQAEEVQRVKYAIINSLIENPVTVFSNQTVGEVLRLRNEKRYSFTSFLVIDPETHALVGVFTGQDLDFCDSYSNTMAAVMTPKPLTESAGISITRAYQLMKERRVKLLPLVDGEGLVAGLYTRRDVKRALYPALYPDNIGPDGRLRVGAAIGVIANPDTEERIERLAEAHVDVVVVDTGHGDSEAVIQTVAWVKRRFPLVDIIAGNISEADSAERLIDAGADGIKVGEGPGSSCTTGLVTGTGVPLATAVYQCVEVARQHGVPVGADGGFRWSGDMVKALATGADYVVLGNLLAGTSEAPGEAMERDGRWSKEYRGMGSEAAMREREGSRNRYDQAEVLEEDSEEEIIPEGVEGRVPYTGPLRKVAARIRGGMRKGFLKVGALDVIALREKAKFYYVPGGNSQAHPTISDR